MNILLKSTTVIDPNSPFHNQTVDIFIENGIVTEIGESIQKENVKVIDQKGLHISPGLFDMQADFSEPGAEWKEDLHSGMEAAAKGGFTEVAVTPNTNPVTDTKSTVSFIKRNSKGSIVNLHPIGAISKGLKGEELSEMYDMQQSGAIAYSDYKKNISSSGLMSRALLYAKNFNGLVISFPFDSSLAHHGQMNEGIVSTTLGLETIPHLAEEIRISRDLFLAGYNEAKIHFSLLSSGDGLNMIREARENNIQVTCGIAMHQLAYTDEAVTSFDSNYKVLPPFRTENDINLLIEGLQDGTIDVIVSDHSPQDIEEKQKEFDLAAFGISSIETSFSLACTLLKEYIGLEGIVQKMAINPRTILQMDLPIVKVGFEANFTLFNPNETFELKENDIRSKSKNTPFIGKVFTGKVKGIINNNQLELF